MTFCKFRGNFGIGSPVDGDWPKNWKPFFDPNSNAKAIYMKVTAYAVAFDFDVRPAGLKIPLRLRWKKIEGRWVHSESEKERYEKGCNKRPRPISAWAQIVAESNYSSVASSLIEPSARSVSLLSAFFSSVRVASSRLATSSSPSVFAI